LQRFESLLRNQQYSGCHPAFPKAQRKSDQRLVGNESG
jgi:hypothetical protein